MFELYIDCITNLNFECSDGVAVDGRRTRHAARVACFFCGVCRYGAGFFREGMSAETHALAGGGLRQRVFAWRKPVLQIGVHADL